MPEKPGMTAALIQRAVYAALASNAKSIKIPWTIRSDPEMYQHVEWVLMDEGRCNQPDAEYPAVCTMEANHEGGHGWQTARVAEISLTI